MLRAFRRILGWILKRTRLYGLYTIYNHGYLHEMGWFDSYWIQQATDRERRPIPWITYPCLTFLEERITNSMEVFEYGAGNSTLWWSTRVKRVVSCEHNLAWYERTKSILPSNVELYHVPLEDGATYSNFVAQYQYQFDVVFIDGRDRVTCIHQALGALKPGGVLILDNSDEAEYSDGLGFMKANGYKQLHFKGPGPITPAVWRTTIFYKAGNCLEI